MRNRVNGSEFNCFYFCPHFFEAFEKTCHITEAVVIQKLYLKRSSCLLEIMLETLHS